MNPDSKFVVKFFHNKHSCMPKDAQERGYFVRMIAIKVYGAKSVMSYGNPPAESLMKLYICGVQISKKHKCA